MVLSLITLHFQKYFKSPPFQNALLPAHCTQRADIFTCLFNSICFRFFRGQGRKMKKQNTN